MSSSLLPNDITVTKCRPIVHTNLFKSNSSLPVVDDKYSFIRARNTLVSLIMSIKKFDPPSFRYYLSDNGTCIFCEFLRVEYCVV